MGEKGIAQIIIKTFYCSHDSAEKMDKTRISEVYNGECTACVLGLGGNALKW